jgi:hypothetical protein
VGVEILLRTDTRVLNSEIRMGKFPIIILTDEDLKMMAECLPIYPPMPMNPKDKEATVKDFYPDLTDDELDRLMKFYKGFLERG